MLRKFEIRNGVVEKLIYSMLIVLKGLGQIMLQENAVTGLLFLIGIFYGSFIMGAAALLAVVCGTTTALLLKYEKSEIDKGFYGFSAALVGVAAILFLKPVLISWIIIIIGSTLAAVLQHLFIKRKIPVFTLPFVLVIWLILFFANNFFTSILPEPSVGASITDNFTFAIKGFGQVIFQDSLVSGLLFFIAVFISSPISALYGLAGAILSAVVAFKLSAPASDISLGLFSYNAVLCAIVFAGNQIKDGFWVLIAVLLSLSISFLMLKFNITQLTFPFVLASCITLLFRKHLGKSIQKETTNQNTQH